MKKTLLLVGIFSMLFFVGVNAQKYEGLADTPPMGWNSWNIFHCDINEDMIKGIADAMVNEGLCETGYKYLNLDDCWHGERDANGFIQCDPVRFHSGIKALADYIHSKGLKIGIYSDAGYKTCAGKPGSLGHEYQDALQYSRWGIDYLKYDWCNTEGLNCQSAYKLMRDALRAAGRPVLYSLCEGGGRNPWEWAADVGHIWRTESDITNDFKSVLRIVDSNSKFRQYAGKGHWNDPDMLEVGNGMTVNEDRAHFTMWCMMAAPLILGNDLRSMTKETKDIILNKEVIAIDQDATCVQGLRYGAKDSLEFWFKPLVNDEWAFCILNRGNVSQEFNIDWKTFTVKDELSKRSANFVSAVYTIRNLWTKKDEGTTKKIKKVKVGAHDVILFRLQKR